MSVRRARTWRCWPAAFAVDEPRAEPVSPSRSSASSTARTSTGLSTWLKDTKHDDPRRVFRITDGLLHITGDGSGYIATEKEYRDYHLIVEYKWGKRTDGGKFVRNSGILLNAIGPDGGAGGKWMSSIECQLAQGCVGDLIVIRGKDAKGETIPVRLTSETVLGPDKRPRWMKGGEPRVFTNRQLWWSRHDPDFKELLDTRGKNDVESPTGRVDPGRVPVRREPDHDPRQRHHRQRVLRRLPRGRQDPAAVRGIRAVRAQV